MYLKGKCIKMDCRKTFSKQKMKKQENMQQTMSIILIPDMFCGVGTHLEFIDVEL